MGTKSYLLPEDEVDCAHAPQVRPPHPRQASATAVARAPVAVSPQSPTQPTEVTMQNARTVAERADKLFAIPAVKAAQPWVREVVNEIAASAYPMDKAAVLLSTLCASTNIPLNPVGAE